MRKLFLAIGTMVLISSCTKNEMAKEFGGSMVIDLPAGKKLINVTWKDSDLWYLTKKMSTKDSAETYVFHESSTYGIQEGTVTIKEHTK